MGTILLTDCQAARDVIVKPGGTQRTKYFERTTLLVKRLYMIGVITPVLVTTDNMVADILTKPLDRNKLAKFRTYMLNHDQDQAPWALSQPPRGERGNTCLNPCNRSQPGIPSSKLVWQSVKSQRRQSRILS